MTAADKPVGADDLDAAYAEIRRDPYIFTWAAREWTLPHLSDLDFRIQLKIETAESLDVNELIGLFGEMFGAGQAEAWAQVQVPTPVLFLLFERWLKHSGAKPGEDSASSGSSGSTGKSSRRTSGASTASGSRKPSTAAKKAAPAKKAAKRAPRKVTTAAAGPLTADDQEWLAKHQKLAASPPASSSP